MPRYRALLPVKNFAQAKSRLRPVLSEAQCQQFARHMLADVLRALQACEPLGGITLLGDPAQLRDEGPWQGFPVIADSDISDSNAPQDFNRALARAAGLLAAEGTETLLVLPADLPTLTARAVAELLQQHVSGVTICRAARDGGTNALVLSPPDAIGFRFGPDSATQHQAAALANGLEARVLDLPAFARDIDTPADLEWLVEQRVATASAAWLRSAGLAGSARRKRASA